MAEFVSPSGERLDVPEQGEHAFTLLGWVRAEPPSAPQGEPKKPARRSKAKE